MSWWSEKLMSKPFVVINIHSSWLFDSSGFCHLKGMLFSITDLFVDCQTYITRRLSFNHDWTSLLDFRKNRPNIMKLEAQSKEPIRSDVFSVYSNTLSCIHRDLKTFYSFQAARRVAKLFLGPTRVFVAAVEMSKGNGGAPKRYTWVLTLDCKLRSLDWFRMDRCSKESNTFIKVETFCIQIGGELN